jgi:hypothetical protein
LTGRIEELFPADAIGDSFSSPFDAFAALDDLMCVVEALCPVWPERPISANPGIYRL